jgi:hypothetical protein
MEGSDASRLEDIFRTEQEQVIVSQQMAMLIEKNEYGIGNGEDTAWGFIDYDKAVSWHAKSSEISKPSICFAN